MSRINPNVDLRFSVLYRSARTCCICRQYGKATQIHHIDQNSSNTVEENLALLCQDCHDEAHTIHKLSQNLSQDDIRRSKAEWEKLVEGRQMSAMLPERNLEQASWNYINQNRIYEVIERHGIAFESHHHARLRSLGVVDEYGIMQPLSNPPPEQGTWTHYDYLPFNYRFPTKKLFTDAIDSLILKSRPLDLSVIWRRRELRKMISPGSLVFLHRGFYFKKKMRFAGKRYELLKCFTSKSRIRVEFEVSTLDMFANSSWGESFRGLRTAAVLLIFKSFEERNRHLILHCTPIAMGVGFMKYVSTDEE